jgi:hypothetical protein
MTRSKLAALVTAALLPVAGCASPDADVRRAEALYAEGARNLNATVTVNGEALTVESVACPVVEGAQRVFAYFETEPRHHGELDVRDYWVRLMLPTELDDPQGVDSWHAEAPSGAANVEGVTELSAQGASGRLVLEGRDIGSGVREPMSVEFDVRCPN